MDRGDGAVSAQTFAPRNVSDFWSFSDLEIQAFGLRVLNRYPGFPGKLPFEGILHPRELPLNSLGPIKDI